MELLKSSFLSQIEEFKERIYNQTLIMSKQIQSIEREIRAL